MRSKEWGEEEEGGGGGEEVCMLRKPSAVTRQKKRVLGQHVMTYLTFSYLCIIVIPDGCTSPLSRQ